MFSLDEMLTVVMVAMVGDVLANWDGGCIGASADALAGVCSNGGRWTARRSFATEDGG